MKKIIKWLLLGLVIAGLVIGVLYQNKPKQSTELETQEEPIEEEKDEISYKEVTHPTDLLKNIYPKLMKAHQRNGGIFEPEYAAAYFACDFFTWSNKTEREDIGGINLVLPQEREDFASYALRDYYLNFTELQEEYGVDHLPEVESYRLLGHKTSDFVYEVEGFENLEYQDITLSLQYKESDLYDVSALKSTTTITLVNYNDLWYVVGVDYQK